MTISNVDRFGIVFTVVFVGSVYVIINVILTSLSENDKIILAMICVTIISAMGIYSYRKKQPKQSFSIRSRTYTLFFIFGVFMGGITMWIIDIVNDKDYEAKDLLSFLILIFLTWGGYSGLYYLIAMAMIVSIFRIPFVRQNLSGFSRWFPFIEGTTFGFGMMTFVQLYWNGLPKPCLC